MLFQVLILGLLTLSSACGFVGEKSSSYSTTSSNPDSEKDIPIEEAPEVTDVTSENAVGPGTEPDSDVEPDVEPDEVPLIVGGTDSIDLPITDSDLPKTLIPEPEPIQAPVMEGDTGQDFYSKSFEVQLSGPAGYIQRYLSLNKTADQVLNCANGNLAKAGENITIPVGSVQGEVTSFYAINCNIDHKQSDEILRSFTYDSVAPLQPLASATTHSFNTDFDLSLSIDSSKAIAPEFIVYTIDGQKPESCSDGNLYSDSDPILVDKTLTLHAAGCDDAGNMSDPISYIYTKDTIPPASPLIVINNGDSHTSTLDVNLTLGTDETPYQMMLSSMSDCLSDAGVWESFSPNKVITLADPGSGNSASLAAKYRDIATNETACVSANIIFDNTRPNIIDVNSSTADGSHGPGNVIALQITFDEVVYVTGTPTMGLDLDSGEKSIDYVSGSGTTTLSFYYTVAPGDNSNDLQNTAALDLSGGASIADFTGNAAFLAFPTGAGSLANNKNLIIDTDPPTFPSIDILGGASYTNQSSVSLNLNVTDATEMYVTNTPTCSNGGSWESLSPTKASWPLAQSNATATVFVKYRDAARNESSCTSDDIIHDNIPPVVSNISSFHLDGYYIVGDSLLIDVTFDKTVFVTGTPSLSLALDAGAMPINYISGTGTNTLSFSYTVAPGDNTANLQNTTALSLNGGSIVDQFSNNAVLTLSTGAGSLGSNKNLVIDTSPPSAPSISIEGAATHTNVNQVELTLGVTDATEMYITNTPACNDGGSWESLSTSKSSWTLAQTNALATVYVKYRDAALNESSCASDDITHDDTQPTISNISSSNPNGYYVAGDSLLIDVTFDEPVFVTGTPSLGLVLDDGEKSIDYTSGSGTNTLSFNYIIAAGDNVSDLQNTASLSLNGGSIDDVISNGSNLVLPTGAGSLGANKNLAIDTSPPISESIAILAGATITNQSSVTLNLGVTGATQMYITNTATCSGGGTWESLAATRSSWPLAQSNTTATVYVKYRDAVLNESTCVSDDILHDNTQPTVVDVNSDELDGNYFPGESISVDVTFDEIIFVTGTPTLGLVLDAGVKAANYSGGSGTSTLSFSYVVAATDNTTDLQNTAALNLSGGSIVDAGANNAILALPTGAGSLGNNKDISIDTTAPSAPNISIEAGASSTNKSFVNLNLGVSNGIEMYVTNTSGCSTGGGWETFSAIKSTWPLAQANATANVYVKYRDEYFNESTCVGDSILHDNISPTATNISSMTPDGTYVAGDTIVIDVSFDETVIVSGPLTLDLTLDAGTKPVSYSSGSNTSTLSFSYTVAAGDDSADLQNTASLVLNGGSITDSTSNDAILTLSTGVGSLANNKNLVIDNTGPTATSISIEGGASHINSSSVNLNLVATDASHMYITNSSDCNTGGGWESFSATKSSWSLSQANTTATVYVKYRDTAGNISACISDNIIHDVTPPTATSISIANGATTIATTSTGLSLGASGALEMYITNTPGCSTGGSWENFNTSRSWILGQSDSTANVYVKYRDTAGNVSTCISDDISHSDTLGYQQKKYLKAANISSGDLFGGSVAISGDTVIVSAISEDSNQTSITNGSSASTDDSSTDTGAVYVYRQNGANWVQEAYIKASNADSNDKFGASIAIDNDTMVVSAEGEDSDETFITNGSSSSSNNDETDSGAVYVYRRSGTTWTQEAYLKASDSGTGNSFGKSVDISGDTIVVGSTAMEAAYVFKRTGSTWVEEAILTPPNNGGDHGWSVGISGDTIVVGAPKESSNQTTITNGTSASADTSQPDTGAAYVYVRSGSIWTQEAYIKASNSEDFDEFGRSVDIDGNTIVVGARSEDSNQRTISNGSAGSADNLASNTGAAYVYVRSSGTWTEEAYLKASNADSGDLFGAAVSISQDRIAVGAYAEASGINTIINGAAGSSDNSAIGSGAVYVFNRSGSIWAEESYVKASNGESSDYLGFASWLIAYSDNGVAISGDAVIAAAPGEDSGLPNTDSDNSAVEAGAAYIFH